MSHMFESRLDSGELCWLVDWNANELVAWWWNSRRRCVGEWGWSLSTSLWTECSPLSFSSCSSVSWLKWHKQLRFHDFIVCFCLGVLKLSRTQWGKLSQNHTKTVGFHCYIPMIGKYYLSFWSLDTKIL